MAYVEIPPNSSGVDAGTLVTNSSNTQDWTFLSGIVGDNIGLLYLKGEIIAGASTQTFTIQPNGSAPTACDCNALNVNTAGVTASNLGNQIYLGQVFTNTRLMFRAEFDLKKSRNRIWTCRTQTVNGANAYGEIIFCNWRDTSTAVTSIAIHGSAANSVQASSTVIYWTSGVTA